jgi:hypothetical protein
VLTQHFFVIIMNMKKETSIKIGNTMLAGGIAFSALALLSYFFPFSGSNTGLNLFNKASLNAFALTSFILFFIALFGAAAIFLFQKFPGGKIILVFLSLVILVAGILLFLINMPLAYGAILAIIFAFIGAISFLVSSLFK